MSPVSRIPGLAIAVGSAVLLLPTSASAQRVPFATPSSGFTLEAGAFVYGRERYHDDGEFRFLGGVGWRLMRGAWFVEPHVRLMDGLETHGDVDDCLDGPCEDGVVTEPLASFWPGATVGAATGDARLSHALALRAAVGIGESLQPLVGLRYEGAARRAGWFVEGSLDLAPWADVVYDPFTGGWDAGPARDRWLPGLSVGLRIWFRGVEGVERPERPEDPGIIPPDPAPAAADR